MKFEVFLSLAYALLAVSSLTLTESCMYDFLSVLCSLSSLVIT